MGDKKIRLDLQRDVEQEKGKGRTNRRKPKVEKRKVRGIEITQGRSDSNPPGGLTAEAMVSLQNHQGNAYVQQVVKRVQATPDSDKKEEERLDRTIQNLQQHKGSGHPLEGETREQMEQGLGYDFSQVRLHTDKTAHETSETLGAKAFTMGTDIFLSEKNSGEISSSEGRGLLAHELTHVVQQSRGHLSLPGSKVKMGQVGDTYEQEADTIAEGVVRGGQPLPRQAEEEEEMLQAKAAAEGVQRQVEEEEEEELQAKLDTDDLQRQAEEEEEEEEETLQTKATGENIQKQVEEEEEEEIQTKRDEGKTGLNRWAETDSR